jgi:hypothetical protein
MGKMKELMMSMTEEHEHDDDELAMCEEAHYVHTLNDVVELMIVYGFDAVMDDVLIKLGEKIK